MLVTESGDLRDRVLATAAAVGVEVRWCRDPAELAAGPPPRILVVGADQLAAVARSPLIGRAAVHGVGLVGDRDRLCEWSAALGAAVIVLPEGVRWLAAALAGSREGPTGRVVGLVGGSGGVGTSTMAAGLAWSASRQGVRTALVDLDPRGGGLDVLLGLEEAPGWRWPALAAADGFLSDLHEHLPRLDTLAVVSHDREARAELPTTATVAVVRALARCHDLVVLDGGTRPGTAELEALRAADGVLLVCAGDLRGLAAAAQQVRILDAHLPLAAVHSRIRPGGYGAAVVARTLGLPVVATLPADRRIPACLERGEPPGRVAGRAWRRCCATVIDNLVEAPLTRLRPLSEGSAL